VKVIPAIDLRGGRVVRLVEGAPDRETRYDVDPVETALAWQRAGAAALHVVDLDGAFAGERGEANRETIRAIVAALAIPIEIGGGLRSEASVAAALEAGAHWAVLGTVAVERFDLVTSLAAAYPGRIVVGIDARDGFVATHGWTDVTSIEAVELARRAAGAGVERAIYTDISRDGRLVGPNVDATARLARESGLHVTASGGVGSLDDLRRLAAAEPDGVDACVVGKALFEGRFTLREAIAAAGEPLAAE
jgi:phosphoribosylformimino-5-aminoimidazole carboxamide ribotide isomerase